MSENHRRFLEYSKISCANGSRYPVISSNNCFKILRYSSYQPEMPAALYSAVALLLVKKMGVNQRNWSDHDGLAGEPLIGDKCAVGEQQAAGWQFSMVVK